MNNDNYFLGLDIGTDSVGYAVTDTSEYYNLLKYHGEPMWGVTLFDEAGLSDARRGFRTARRRLDRRQQRVKLIQEIFAKEIYEKDPKFYKRIEESALLRCDAEEPYCLFNDDNYTDADYHEKYPTIHHLICELLENKEPHDVRLVYIACAWLVAHRGHFLAEISEDNITSVLDFTETYKELMNYFFDLSEGTDILPWYIDEEKISVFGEIIKSGNGITKKYQDLCLLLFDNTKAPKQTETEDSKGFPYSIEGILKLLCGGEFKLSKLYAKDEYDELGSFSLSKDDETYDSVLKTLGDDGELLIKLKGLFDWAILSDLLMGKKYLSIAKVETYNQHKKDLADLKKYIKKNCPDKYKDIFRIVNANNYVAYSGNVSSVKNKQTLKKCNSQKDFCDYLKKALSLKEETVNNGIMSKEMYERITSGTFMPKQVNGDNRVIPYQLYYAELKKILENAAEYLPFIMETDSDGYVTFDKILSVMKFRVPYYVGPLNKVNNEHAWIERKASGKILPWNFEEKVDLDRSEECFIRKMTNTCTYLAGEDVLPKHSLLYEKFEVLNEINNIKINGKRIDVATKQLIFNELFVNNKKVTVRQIKGLLCKKCGCSKEDADTISGIDTDIKSSLCARVSFNRLISSGQLSEEDVELIIKHMAYSEDKIRFRKWLETYYSKLSEEDIKDVSSLKLKEFGRLSRALLDEVVGTNTKNISEDNTVIGFMWETNDNLSEILLSDKYTFMDYIQKHNTEYYKDKSSDLSQRLDEMYVSNAVKRPIIRAMEIVNDVVKANGGAPKKIFVEMARGTKEEQKNKRTISRKQQLIDLYKQVKTEDARELAKVLENKTDNDLQSDKLFLYFTQLGKCMYSGEKIDIDSLMNGKMYDIDHIYPQSYVKDDSIINNKVLVLSEENGKKGNKYPIVHEIREEMKPYWQALLKINLISEEKYRRLVRNTPFSEDEAWGFINRQLVETRQSTKVVAELLKEQFPETEIVYVKAGIVSDFRHDYDMLKSRTVNDLHHAKDAYLNIVCGNVYSVKFTRDWFLRKFGSEEYTVNAKTLFSQKVKDGERTIWQGSKSIARIKEVVQKSNAHMSFYSVIKKHGQNGGFFDQNPLKAGKGGFPRKNNLPVEKYGGYSGLTTAFSVLVKYSIKKKIIIEIIPVSLLFSEKFCKDTEYAKQYISERIDPKASGVEILLDYRRLKIGTVFEIDGLRLLFGGQGSKDDTRLGLKVFTPLVLGSDWETYIKHLESFKEKSTKGNIVYSEQFDKVKIEKNIELYDLLEKKLKEKPYCFRPENQSGKISNNRFVFIEKDVKEQVNILLNIISQFNRTALNDSNIKIDSSCRLNAKLNNWNQYSKVYIVDQSPSGIWEKKSVNLLELL